jgi:hypothetical protein
VNFIDEAAARIVARQSLEDANKLMIEALTSIAQFDDSHAEERLATRGSWSGFDEPCSAQRAREALAAVGALPA